MEHESVRSVAAAQKDMQATDALVLRVGEPHYHSPTQLISRCRRVYGREP